MISKNRVNSKKISITQATYKVLMLQEKEIVTKPWSC